MRRTAQQPFFGWIILFAVMYAPIVVYTLWIHFKDYAGPHWPLILPVLAAIFAGFEYRKLSALRCAALLSGTAYALAVAASTFEAGTGSAKWYEVPMTVAFGAMWYATAILVPTAILVLLGRALWFGITARTR